MYFLQLFMSSDFADIAKLLAFNFIDPTDASNKYVAKMARMTREIRGQYKYRFRGMVRRLESCSGTWTATLRAVADSLFEKGVYWERIVSLFAFAQEWFQYALDHPELNHRDDDLHIGNKLTREERLRLSFASALEHYINIRLKIWIQQRMGKFLRTIFFNKY